MLVAVVVVAVVAVVAVGAVVAVVAVVMAPTLPLCPHTDLQEKKIANNGKIHGLGTKNEKVVKITTVFSGSIFW